MINNDIDTTNKNQVNVVSFITGAYERRMAMKRDSVILK